MQTLRVICSCENGTRFNFAHTIKTTIEVSLTSSLRLVSFAKVAIAADQMSKKRRSQFLSYTMYNNRYFLLVIEYFWNYRKTKTEKILAITTMERAENTWNKISAIISWEISSIHTEKNRYVLIIDRKGITMAEAIWHCKRIDRFLNKSTNEMKGVGGTKPK